MIVHKQLDQGTLLPVTSANITTAKMKFVNYDTITFHILAATSPDATVAIQRSVDGTNWVEVSSDIISGAGVTEQLVKGEVALYYRAVISSYAAGDFSIEFNAA